MAGLPLWILAVAVGITRVKGTLVFSSPTAIDPEVPTPPHVWISSVQDTEYIGEDRGTTLRCHATGNPPPKVQWFRNGEPLDPGHHPDVRVIPQNGTVVISHFVENLEGVYQCRAANAYGISLSRTVRLLLRVDPEFRNTGGQGRRVEVSEGGAAKLECKDQPAWRPRGHYEWYHSARENEKIVLDESGRREIDENGTFYILEARPSDAAETYACAMASIDWSWTNVAETPYVSVYVTDTQAPNSKPEVMGSTWQATEDIGGEVTLECYFRGKPRPTIVWVDSTRNQRISSGTRNRISLSPSGHKLTIRNLQDDDEGQYRCEASNDLGTANARAFLNVTSPPYFKTSPGLTVSTAGSDVTFTCRAQGALDEVPVSRPLWTTDGEPLSANDTRKVLSDDGTQLTVFNVTKADMMCVQCNVTNSRGHVFGDGYLAVIDPLQVAQQPNRTIEIDPETQSVDLTIVAAGDECCAAKFHWSLNGQYLSKPVLRNPPYSYTQGKFNATLTVHLTGDSQAGLEQLLGEYRCDVWHPAYAENTTVLVSMTQREIEEPEARPLKEKAFNLWWLALVGGILLLVGAVIVIIVMIRNNYPRSTYLLDKEEKKHNLNPEKEDLDRSFHEI